MRLLIDTDPGIDDALALLLALHSAGVSVEAITTVAGNVTVEQATQNTFRILDVARPDPMPRVARGAEAPLARELVTAHLVHGDDGLGNLDQLVDPDGVPRYPIHTHNLEMTDGPDVILEMLDRFGSELVVVALGPLTNLAAALRRDPRRVAQAARIVVMGGAISAPGNVTPAAEFNFYVDPEAAAAVFEAGLPLELVPLDVTRRVVLREDDLAAKLRGSGTSVARFVADFTRHGFASGGEGIFLHDPLAVAVAIDPSLVGFEPLAVEVECEGRITRGMSVADRRSKSSGPRRPPNCRVALSVDAARVVSLLFERLCPASA
jgi:purine nucleosidase/pyrimidine-specific ribonucleoside hydrolase